MFARFLAVQLRQPSGLFGRFVMLPLLNRVNVSINALAIEQLELSSHDNVLEVGFGGGGLLARLVEVANKGEVTGVDFSPEATAQCAKKFARFVKTGRMALHCADAQKLPFASNTFTKACTVNTIYFWPEPGAVLAELRRVMNQDGRLVVCFSPRELMKDKEVMQHGFTLYDPEEVASLLLRAGFRNVRLAIGKHRMGECVAATGEK